MPFINDVSVRFAGSTTVTNKKRNRSLLSSFFCCFGNKNNNSTSSAYTPSVREENGNPGEIIRVRCLMSYGV